jgi:tetratricopeptide (TPR) repeat protein
MTLDSLGDAYLAKGMYPEAIAEYTKAGSPAKLGYAYAVSGNKAKAREILKQLNAESKSQYVSPESQARVFAGLGDQQEAISWLEKAEREHAALHHINVDPEFNALHTNPRFQDLLRRIGLAR